MILRQSRYCFSDTSGLTKNLKTLFQIRSQEPKVPIELKFHLQNSQASLDSVRSKYLTDFYKNIQNNILYTQQDSLQTILDYQFSKQGKLIRPIINFILYELSLKKLDESAINKDRLNALQTIWASCCEILHISSLIHDDIIDKSPMRRGQPALHMKASLDEALQTANFMVGRCGRSLAQCNSVPLYQTYAKIIDNLSSGEHLQARKNRNFDDLDQLIEDYFVKTYYKTGSLISNASKGVQIILQKETPLENSADSIFFEIGKNLGMAFQIMDDVLDYEGDAAALGKEAKQDLKEGHLTAPILLILPQVKKDTKLFQKIQLICNQSEKTDQEIEYVCDTIHHFGGIELSRSLAPLFVQEASDLAEGYLNDTEGTEGVKAIGSFFLNRKN